MTPGAGSLDRGTARTPLGLRRGRADGETVLVVGCDLAFGSRRRTASSCACQVLQIGMGSVDHLVLCPPPLGGVAQLA